MGRGFVSQMMVVSVALLLCYFVISGFTLPREGKSAAGKKGDIVLVNDMDAEAWKAVNPLFPLQTYSLSIVFATLHTVSHTAKATAAESGTHKRLYLLFHQLKVHLA